MTNVPSPCEWNANSFCFVVDCPYTGLFSWEILNFYAIFRGGHFKKNFFTDQCTKILRLQKGPASGLLSVLPQKLLQGC